MKRINGRTTGQPVADTSLLLISPTCRTSQIFNTGLVVVLWTFGVVSFSLPSSVHRPSEWRSRIMHIFSHGKCKEEHMRYTATYSVRIWAASTVMFTWILAECRLTRCGSLPRLYTNPPRFLMYSQQVSSGEMEATICSLYMGRRLDFLSPP